MKSSSLEIHPGGDRGLLFSGVWTQLQLKLSLTRLWVMSKPGLAHPEGSGDGQRGVVSACILFRSPCAPKKQREPSKARDHFRKKNGWKNGDLVWKSVDGEAEM